MPKKIYPGLVRRILMDRVPGDLLDKFKARCALFSTPMRTVIIDLLKKAIEDASSIVESGLMVEKPYNGKLRVFTVDGIPDSVLARFKARCALQNVSMKRKIFSLMREYCKETSTPTEPVKGRE